MEFKHSVPVQLRFNDADALGHVNNSVYFTFYDLGKTEYFKAVRGGEIPKEIDIVVAHAEVDFIAPVFLNDQIEVQTTVSEIGNKSFELIQRIVDTKNNITKCFCKTIMVGFDVKTNTSKQISDEWREAISAFEGVDFSKRVSNFENYILYMNTNFKVGDKILVSPYLTHKQDWEEGIIIEVEYNTIFNGFVISVEMSDGDVFFQRATPDYFQLLNSK